MPDTQIIPQHPEGGPNDPDSGEKLPPFLRSIRFHLRRGESITALQELLRLSARDRARPEALRELAHTYLSLGNKTLAESALTDYLRKSPRDADAWVILSRTQRELHRTYVARDSLLQAIRLQPADERYLAELASLYRELDHSDSALSVARRMMEINANSARGHFEAGLSYLSWGRYGDAMAHLKMAVAQDPLMPGLPEAQRRAEKSFEECTRELQAAEERIRANGETPDEIEHLASLLVCVGDVEQGLLNIDKVMRANPGRAATLELRGRILIEMDRYEESVAALRRCEEIDPERSFLGFHQRRIQRLIGDEPERTTFYRRQMKVHPEQYWWPLNLALLLLDTQRAAEANRVLTAAVRAYPDQHVLFETLARAQESLGRPHGALRSLFKASQLAPRDPEVWNALGNQRARMGQTEEARTAFRQALLLHPEFEWPHHNLALLALQERNLDQCVREARLALDANPEYVEARHTLSVALFRLGRYREAEDECLRTLELASDDWRAHLNLANACDALGEHDRAREAYEKAIELNGSDPAVYLDFGIFWAAQGKLERAIRFFEVARRLAPRSGDVYNNLGLAWLKRKNLRMGIQYLRKAVHLAPDNAAAHYNLGMALYRAGRFSEALSHTRRSIELEPSYAAAHNDLGCTLEKLGRFPEAAQAYRKTLELNPNEPLALNNLASLYFKRPQGGLVTRTEARDFLLRALPHLKESRQVRETFRALERLEQHPTTVEKKPSDTPDKTSIPGSAARPAARGLGKRRKPGPTQP